MLVPLQYFILFHPALPRFTPLQYFPIPIRYASRRTNISQAAPRRQISLRPLRGRKIPPGVLYTVHPVNFTPGLTIIWLPLVYGKIEIGRRAQNSPISPNSSFLGGRGERRGESSEFTDFTEFIIFRCRGDSEERSQNSPISPNSSFHGGMGGELGAKQPNNK